VQRLNVNFQIKCSDKIAADDCEFVTYFTTFYNTNEMHDTETLDGILTTSI